MSWNVRKVEAMRLDFVHLALHPDSNVRDLCRRFAISSPTGYKWINRYKEEGSDGLKDRTRRPHTCPSKTDTEQEVLVLSLRVEHPAWGGRKLRRRLQDLGHKDIPATSTITDILRRNGMLNNSEEHPGPFQRFSRPCPNELWQMDFKGEFRLHQGWCHPLTVLDDCSRYALCVAACSNQQRTTVQDHLISLFRRYGLPQTMLTDNGKPWGSSGDPRCLHTGLGVWLMRLGVRLIHGRPYHPQTQGKDERFHKTLKTEVLNRRELQHLEECQDAFDQWRSIYNHQRPHEALNLDVPSAHYYPSPRPYPETLPEPEYLGSDIIRIVKSKGEITFRNQFYAIGHAFVGSRIAIRATHKDSIYEVFFGPYKLGRIDLSAPAESKWKYARIRDDHPPFSFENAGTMC
jgi:transposase InsO family protein